jgi:hypothetical protein
VRPTKGKRGRLRAWWGRAIWWRVPSSGEYLAGARLQWGAERGPTVGAGPVCTEALRVGPEVHGERVQRVADRSHVRVVKP